MTQYNQLDDDANDDDDDDDDDYTNTAFPSYSFSRFCIILSSCCHHS